MSEIRARQPPQPVPARVQRPTSATVSQPSEMASSIVPAVTALHMHTVASRPIARGAASSAASSRSRSDRSAGSSARRAYSTLSSAAVRGIPTLTKPVRTPSRVTIFV